MRKGKAMDKINREILKESLACGKHPEQAQQFLAKYGMPYWEYRDKAAALSPNAVVIPIEHLKKMFKPVPEHYDENHRQQVLRNKGYNQALTDAIAILSQYGEQK
jgi:hypothetical protein